MSPDIDWLVQRKIYEELKSSTHLRSLLGSEIRVYDEIPQDVKFPFLTLGESKISSLDGLQKYLEHDVKIQIYSRYGGRKEIKNIMGIVKDVMQESIFDLGKNKYANLFFIFGDIWKKSERGVYRGILKFRIHTHIGPEAGI